MQRTRTFVRTGARSPNTSGRSYPPRSSDHRWTYFFLLLFTLVLYSRPEDYVPGLTSTIHLALILSICAAGCYFQALVTRQTSVVWTTQLKLALALTIWYILGIPAAYWPSHALETLTSLWLKTLLIFFLTTQAALSIQRIRGLLWAIIFSEFVVAALSLIMRPHELSEASQRLSGVTVGFLSGNYLGIAVAMTFPFMVIFLLNRPGAWKAVFLVVTFGLVSWMLILTASRSGFLTLLISVVATWFLLLRQRLAGRVMGFVLAGCLLAVTVLAPKVFWDRIATIWTNRETAVAVSAEESASLRSQALHNSIIFSLEHPVFGLGMGNFPIANGQFSHTAVAWIGTHNMFTEESSEGGIPALLLFIGLLSVSVRDMWRLGTVNTNHRHSLAIRSFARATLVALLVFIFGGLFAHISDDYYLYYVVGMSCCLKVIAQRHVIERPAVSRTTRHQDSKRRLLRARPVGGQ